MKRVEQVESHLNIPVHLFRLSEEVQDAMKNDNYSTSRIVALESTIVCHGMPYPANVQCAKDLERIVRNRGAVPATIAIIRGVVHIGLSESELEHLGKEGPRVMKCSRRDIPYAIALKRNGATTVAATILLASMVGIRVMATGGIGGVHQHGEVTMDVSADLTELSRTPVLVVCAGAKSVLDIPRTLEVLETQGVPVIAHGTDDFPAFFTRKSGCKAPMRMDSTEEIAKFVHSLSEMKLNNGAILAVPIPTAMEAEGELIETSTQKALSEIREKKITGRDVTPYLLRRVNELSGGKSLEANLALVKNNAYVAAKIARKLHQIYPEMGCSGWV